jgi:hypothetical protein
LIPLPTTIALRALPSTDQVEKALAGMSVMTMASGELPGEFKFFVCARRKQRKHILIQSNIEKTPDPLMIVTMRLLELAAARTSKRSTSSLRDDLALN